MSDYTIEFPDHAHDDHDHGHGHEAPTQTGVPNKKLAMWAFLASDCMFFGTLISTHLIYRRISPGDADTTHMFDIMLTAFMTMVLLFSSFFMLVAISAAQKRNMSACWKNLGVVAGLGILFLGVMGYEYYHLAHAYDLYPWSSVFGSTFYTLTGVHGLHVTIGVIWILGLFFYALRGRLGGDAVNNLETAALYWHFVDLVWVVIFTVVYLLEFAR